MAFDPRSSKIRRNNEYTLARLAIRLANVSQEDRLHLDRSHYAQLGHRRQHGDLQPDQRDRAAALRFLRPGPAGVGLRDGAATWGRTLRDSPGRFCRPAPSADGVYRPGGFTLVELKSDRRRRAGARAERRSHGGYLPAAW